MMRIQITAGKPARTLVPATLLGQNLETCYGAVEGMLSERLENPKFAPPADPRTGIAHGWEPSFTTMPGIHYELTPGLSLSGHESQLCHCYWGANTLAGLLQNRRQVRKGEKLEVEIWAKVMHAPVTVAVGLRPISAQAPIYAEAELVLDAPYWKNYRVVLAVPRDDNEAVFYCRLHGEGKVWFDQIHLRPEGEGPLCRELLAAIGRLQVPVLRFPGGTLTNNYHWFHGIGPVHSRPVMPDPVFKATTSYEFGTDEYLNLCRAQGIMPHLTVNLGSGTPEEAAEWMAYCAAWFRQQGDKPPTAYIEIGNEQNDLHELGHMTPEMYIATVREFAPRLRLAYPGARLIVKADEMYYGLRPELNRPWREPVLAAVGSLADLFSCHNYQGKWCETDLERQVHVAEGALNLETSLRQLIRDLRAAGLSQPLALTEWNYWLHAGQSDGKGFLEPYDAQHALYVAGALQLLARLSPDVELANFYNLINPMGIFLHRGVEVEETCMATLFQLYRPAFPGRFVPLQIDSPCLGAMAAAVDALSLRQSGKTWLFVINRHPTATARITLAGKSLRGVECTVLAAASPLAPLAPAALVGTGPAPELPPLSVARFCWK